MCLSCSVISNSTTPWTVACRAPPSMGFSRQECWSWLLFPSSGDLPNSGIEPRSPTLQEDFLQSEPPGKLTLHVNICVCVCVCVYIYIYMYIYIYNSTCKFLKFTCADVLSHGRLFVTPWTVAHRVPLSMKFSRQEYWSGLPFPSPNLHVKVHI